MRNKNKIYSLFTIFLLFLIFSNLNSNSDKESSYSANQVIDEEEDKCSDIPYYQPDSSDGITQYETNLVNITYENFDNSGDISDWIVSSPDGGNADTDSGFLLIEGAPDIAYETINVTYNQNIVPFQDGDLKFRFNQVQSLLGEIITSIYYRVGVDWNYISQVSGSSGGWQSVEIPLDAYDTTDDDFSIRFSVYCQYANDYVQIDNLSIETHEFIVEELIADPIGAHQDQDVRVYIAPSFDNWDPTNVTLRYNTTEAQVPSSTLLNASETQNWFNFQIDKDNYSHGDTLYYQISISNDVGDIHTSDMLEFDCNDILLPSISSVQRNISNVRYYNDVEITCHIEDDPDGELQSAIMYIDTNPNPDDSDTAIMSNHTVIPSEGGDFAFIIPELYLYARLGQNTLYYNITALDSAGNQEDYYNFFSVTDNIAPSIELYQVYASNDGIENNESLVVAFNITEPSDGAGLSFSSSPRLFVKINSTPSDGTDYDFWIDRDNTPPTADGGIINFTIGEGNYSYNDTIYFWSNATDISSNVNSTFELPFPDTQKVFVNDTFAPFVINSSSNGDDAIYNASKTLSFTITEPVGASGILPNSVELSYEVNHWNGTGRGTIIDTLPHTGGVINFIINENNYTWNDTVYYQLNVSDNALNNYSSIIGSFYIGDPYAPIVNWLSYNNSIPEYSDDFNITFSVSEDLKASQLASVELFVYNNTGGATPIKIYDFNTTLTGIGGEIMYKINSSITYSRYELNWSLIAIDNANNMNNYTGQITIHDNIIPGVIYQSHNGTGNTFEYDEYSEVSYAINEPIQGSGFNTDGTGLTLYYHNGTSSHSGDYDGFVNVFESIISDYGGVYTFIIPESFLIYEWTIEYWVNISDKQGNVNSTWSALNINFTVNDTTDPIINLDSDYNDDDISYDSDKSIRFTPIEYDNSSRLKNATLFWRINGDPKIAFNGSYICTNVSAGDIGNVFYYWKILQTDVIFKYGDNISFFVEVYDQAGNGANSSVDSFTIIDLVAPSYNEDVVGNTIDYTWRANKTLIFTVFDPAYDNSSGISNITLYYRYQFAPTTEQFDGVLLNDTASLALDTYYFIVELSEFNFTTIGPNLYYFIRIYDVYGNFRDSTVRSFFMHDQAYRMDNFEGPALFEWLPSGNVYFYVEAHMTTNINVFINNSFYNNYYSDRFGGDIDLVAFGHDQGGYFEVEFKFVGNASVKAFNFSVDLFAPDKIEDIDFNVFGTVVELLWDQPGGTDAQTKYRIYRSTDKNNIITADHLLIELSADNLLVELPLGTDSFSDNTVEEGNTYYYIIVAVDRVGHISPASGIITVNIPANPITMIILFVVIGAIAAVSLYAVSKSRTSKKRKMLFSQVDLEKLDVGEETLISEKIITKKAPEWKKIETKAVPKTIVDGFEFAEVPTATVSNIKMYQYNTIGKLISRAAKFELKGEYGELMAIYSIILRMAKRTMNTLLIMSIEAKIEEVYKFHSD